ncbi:MAG: ABC transporter ATP-binding protein [Candidatus Schekmanbacteria bacterium]|nr:ABC transporter ATP-binding protein [Candidatus Schekmanbacteria bacterium]
MIRVEQLTKVYGSGASSVAALRGIDLAIEPGELLALIGPSGSGKTTLLNALGGLDQPTSGAITIDGQDLYRLSARQRARYRAKHLGFVFQDFNLFLVLSAAENVEYPLLLGRIPRRERRQRVDEALARVGLAEKGRRAPADLSGGEKQRVAIARALVHRPVLVLADEPTANLDSETGARIIDLLLELNRELGTTFVICTHDSAVIARVQRVVAIRDGRLL